jgi:delta14-sterol reductase
MEWVRVATGLAIIAPVPAYAFPAHAAQDPVTLSSLIFAAWVIAVFVLALFVATLFLPGKTVMGFAQPGGGRKAYKLNGMSLWVGTHIVLISGVLLFDWSLTPLVEEFWSLFWVANVFAVAFTVVLYITGRRARRPDDEATESSAAVRMLTDLWYGVELNPTWLGVDIKVFAYQPSLIGLSILNAAFAWVQYETHGTLTPQMIAYVAFWWLYMTTHYYYEGGVLSMWDVIAENFGFMLVWGDLVLVPFFYCIGGWYLVHMDPVPVTWVAGIAALHGLGLWIFRGANAQKDRFKRDPDAKIWGKPPEILGGRLLVSGWWGIGRKINYTGEIMVYLSFALCTGFQSVVPYLLPLWLCVLLPHRAWRDEKRCRQKYGPLWDEYTQRAKFRMVPFLY